MRQAECLHQDARHRVTLFRAPEGSRRAVVCFEPGRDRMQGFEPTSCPRFAERQGIDALTVQTARRDWFVSGRSAALARALTQATAGYDEVTATGFSMGGYGALLYSKAAHVCRALVVSPQYCIDPQVAPYDPGRHAKFARIGRSMPLPESQGDTGLGGVLLYDPAIPEDRAHAARIGAAFPHLRLIALPHGGHPATGVIGDANGIGAISTMLIRGQLNAARIRSLHRDARRGSVRYRLSLAHAALPRHPDRALAMLAQIARTAPPQQRLEACLTLLPLDPATGTAALSKLLEDVPDPPPGWARRIGRALAEVPD
ncbi:hypothetical protein [Paracoccus shanxieyensis]|uniref:Alpha/beta hydrolase n=1 Tax=Paracoccus shanxieyensis TaxID=2675752 RepID=A0A6L6J4T1_9RHOB|nr:hypothetical protein [Paracoccus shanxieyensis]MTH65724.1 hypothetical protein [Paracoccus shanxieyensis]MTH88901.1 hypothetical protein [Paracoccus shanxieyensis]